MYSVKTGKFSPLIYWFFFLPVISCLNKVTQRQHIAWIEENDDEIPIVFETHSLQLLVYIVETALVSLVNLAFFFFLFPFSFFWLKL